MTYQRGLLGGKQSALEDAIDSQTCVAVNTTSRLNLTEAKSRACVSLSRELLLISVRTLSLNGKRNPVDGPTQPESFQPRTFMSVPRQISRCSRKRTQRLRRRTMQTESSYSTRYSKMTRMISRPGRC